MRVPSACAGSAPPPRRRSSVVQETSFSVLRPSPPTGWARPGRGIHRRRAGEGAGRRRRPSATRARRKRPTGRWPGRQSERKCVACRLLTPMVPTSPHQAEYGGGSAYVEDIRAYPLHSGRGDHHQFPAVQLERAAAAGAEFARRGIRRPRARPPTRAVSASGRSRRRDAAHPPGTRCARSPSARVMGSKVETSNMASSPRCDDHRIGRRGEVPHGTVVVHGVDRHLPARSQHAVELIEDRWQSASS